MDLQNQYGKAIYHILQRVSKHFVMTTFYIILTLVLSKAEWQASCKTNMAREFIIYYAWFQKPLYIGMANQLSCNG